MEKVKVGDARHLSSEIESLVDKKLPICVDFDGTMVYHHYPEIGDAVPHCIEVLKKWQENGVGIILDTMRSGDELDKAVKWCKGNGIELYGVGKDPKQHEWTNSPKAYGVLSIDDRNLGVPLLKKEGERQFVDWKTIDDKYSDIILGMAKHLK